MAPSSSAPEAQLLAPLPPLPTDRRFTYAELAARQQQFPSWTSWVLKRLSLTIVVALQGLPLTPNVFSVVSVGLAVAAVGVLLAGQGWAAWGVFTTLLILSFCFDQVDGTWARAKGQGSAFGAFLDPFLDEAKDFLINGALILHHYVPLSAWLGERGLLAAACAFFTLKACYYLARNSEPAPRRAGIPVRELRPWHVSLGADKYVFAFPAAAASVHVCAAFLAAYAVLYAVFLACILHKKARRLAGGAGA